MPLSSQNSLARRGASARAGAQAAAVTIAAAANRTMARTRLVAAAPAPRLINAVIALSLGALKPAPRTTKDETTNSQGPREAPRRPQAEGLMQTEHHALAIGPSW